MSVRLVSAADEDRVDVDALIVSNLEEHRRPHSRPCANDSTVE
jgi:capsular polysaccharide biosynthesis protein